MMADSEGEGNISRGNEWEVVSLTASAYATDAGQIKSELKDADQHALFMSGHFVFPPSQHENLPLEPEIQESKIIKDVNSELSEDEGGVSSTKDDDSRNLKDLNSDEYDGIQLFDEKGKRPCEHNTEFEEDPIDLLNKEESLYSSATFSESTRYGENMSVPEVSEPFEQGLDLPMGTSHSPKFAKDDKYSGAEPSWWKKRAASLYAHAKETNTFWSVFIAAAVMGIVILGQRWQQERWQALQTKWQLALNGERSGRILDPISRLKNVIVGGHRYGSIRDSSSSGN